MSAEAIRTLAGKVVTMQRDSEVPVVDQATARAWADAGIMPVSDYLDYCRRFSLRPDRGRPVLRVIGG